MGWLRDRLLVMSIYIHMLPLLPQDTAAADVARPAAGRIRAAPIAQHDPVRNTSIPRSCAAQLDAWCANSSDPALQPCYASANGTAFKVPFLAAFSTTEHGRERAWRCYSPSDLAGADPVHTPIMQRERPQEPC